MQKITIISATNRENSYTEKIANYYKTEFDSRGKSVKLLSLKKFTGEVEINQIYEKTKEEALTKLIDQYLSNTDGFLFVIPEYNGSFPGILKVFIDAIPTSVWIDKKVCLTGVSTGRAGNLRGLEHFTGILHYLKLHVYHNRLPISSIDKIYPNGTSMPEETGKIIEKQIEGFLNF